MDIGRNYRPLIGVVLVSVFAAGLGFVFVTRTNTIVRAPGVVYPIQYVELLSPVSLGRVTEVHKKWGDTVTAGDVILTLDAEDEKLKQEVFQKQIAGIKEVIKEHARAVELSASLKKAAIELARVAEAEAVASIDVPKGRLAAAEAAVKFAGPITANLQINIATKQLELARKTEEEAKLILDNYKQMLEKKAATEFEVTKARLAYEKAQTQTIQSQDELTLLKNSQTVFKLEEAKGKTEEYAGAIKTAQAVVAVRHAELRSAELASVVDEKGKELAAELDRLTVEEKRLDRLIKDKVLKAPVSGLLTDFRIQTGQWINDHGAIGAIFDTSTLIIYAHVQQKDFNRVQVGQIAKITFDGLSREDGPVPAEVLALEPLATPPKADSIEPGAIFQEPLKGSWVPRALVKLKLQNSPLNAKLHVGFTGAVKILVMPENPFAKYFY